MKTTVGRETINAELQRLYQRDGSVRPTVLLKESEPQDAPLHRCFEWDDRKAGHEWRLNQARHIIRVAVITPQDSPEPSRLVHIPIENAGSGQSREGYYKPPEDQSPHEYSAALAAATRALRSAEARVGELQTVARRRADDTDDDMLARIAMALTAVEAARGALDRAH